MTTEMMKLAKKRAMADKDPMASDRPKKEKAYVKGDDSVEYSDEPDFVNKMNSEDQVHGYEQKRETQSSLDDLKKAKMPDTEDMDDHKTMLHGKKFRMMTDLLGKMDGMDAKE